MIPYRETKLLGNEILPIDMYKIDMNMNHNFETHMKILSGFGNKITEEKNMYNVLFPHWHSYFEIIYFTEGSGTLQLNNEYFQVSAGQIVFIDAFDVHSLEGQNKHIALLIDQYKMKHLMDTESNFFPISPQEKLLGKNENEKNIVDNISKYIEHIAEMYNNQITGYHLKIVGYLYEMLGEVKQYFSKRESLQSVNLNDKRINVERLQIILKYISENYTEAVSLNEISSAAGFSPNYFCRFFKNTMGKTFFEYLNYYRCSKAEILLNTTNKTITEIAFETGFNSISYFNKVYKKIKGYSPSKARKH